MKKLKLSIIVFLLFFIISGCSLFEKTEINEEKNTNDNIENVENDETDENQLTPNNVELPNDSHMGILFSKLDLKGEELYDSKEYLKFSKNNDIYFISLKELNEKYNYDISIYKGEDGTICDIEESGILFDIEKKIRAVKKLDKPIVSILIGCSKE